MARIGGRWNSIRESGGIAVIRRSTAIFVASSSKERQRCLSLARYEIMCFDTSGTIRFDTNSLEIERIRVKIRSNLLKHTHAYIYAIVFHSRYCSTRLRVHNVPERSYVRGRIRLSDWHMRKCVEKSWGEGEGAWLGGAIHSDRSANKLDLLHCARAFAQK